MKAPEMSRHYPLLSTQFYLIKYNSVQFWCFKINFNFSNQQDIETACIESNLIEKLMTLNWESWKATVEGFKMKNLELEMSRISPVRCNSGFRIK